MSCATWPAACIPQLSAATGLPLPWSRWRPSRRWRCELKTDGLPRLPEQLEVAAYYVVSESLTNAAKHAQASRVSVEVGVDDDTLIAEIVDDGIGGADSERGTGLARAR